MGDQNERKNVLLICTDHWSGKYLGRAGNQTILTPTLDQLVDSGVHFTNCYSECPICIPARRSLMTGMSPRIHGDRTQSVYMKMPDVKTLAQTFRDNGYQAYAVGKLHVYPQRNRIGFDDVILMEEGRCQYGVMDDYQIWLGEQGYAGQEFLHGMPNNGYETRPWHLPEETHPTSWATRQMIKLIKRRDTTRPGFFYLSYAFPHPPLVPLQSYLDMYRDEPIEDPVEDDWNDTDIFPMKALTTKTKKHGRRQKNAAIRAFYAQCTHIDHQIRLLIGTLREEGLLDNTVIAFTADHGDMLFNHNMVAKRTFYEYAAKIPFIVSGKPVQDKRGVRDERLVGISDVMPTLLDICDIEIPASVDGISAFSDSKREMLYGEVNENDTASRMVHDGRFKLIYYPVGNYLQLFDLQNDPDERHNIAEQSTYTEVRDKLMGFLIDNLYKGDEKWVVDGKLVGLADKTYKDSTSYALGGQRGGHWPQPTFIK